MSNQQGDNAGAAADLRPLRARSAPRLSCCSMAAKLLCGRRLSRVLPLSRHCTRASWSARKSCSRRCGRISWSPTTRWCRASANCAAHSAKPGARLIVTVPRRGYRFEAAEAPPDRRKARSWHPLRFRWKYGILAPLAVASHAAGALAGSEILRRRGFACRRPRSQARDRGAAVPEPGRRSRA